MKCEPASKSRSTRQAIMTGSKSNERIKGCANTPNKKSIIGSGSLYFLESRSEDNPMITTRQNNNMSE